MEQANIPKPILLVVDDVAADGAMIQETFSEHANVVTVTQAAEALPAIEKLRDQAKAVFLSMQMPGLSVMDILRCMKERGYCEKLSVILLTTEVQPRVLMQAFSLGADDALCKPLTKNLVRARLRNALYITRTLAQIRAMQARYELPELADDRAASESATTLDALYIRLTQDTDESAEHMNRIHQLTQRLLVEMNQLSQNRLFNQDSIEQISTAAMLHDVGKLLIPSGMIDKHAKLTQDERRLMEEHTRLGAKALAMVTDFPSPLFRQYCTDICRLHHERVDGRGYPAGLMEEDIPLWVQAVSVADVYASLTSPNAYKPAFTSETALEMIVSGECGAFSPIVLDALRTVAVTMTEDAG